MGFSFARPGSKSVRETTTVNGVPQRGQRSGSAGAGALLCLPHQKLGPRHPSRPTPSFRTRCDSADQKPLGQRLALRAEQHAT